MDKEEFLMAAIADCQETIRFLDTKATLCTSVVGGFLIWVVSNAEDILDPCVSLNTSFYWWFGSFAVAVVLSITTLKLIVFPRYNPMKKINIKDNEKPSPKWFLASNRKGKLLTSFTQLKTEINGASDLRDDLIVELMKVSFIRNRKNQFFPYLLTLIILASITFTGMVITFYQ